MTAVVGILNKQAVALAADSAVTIGGPNGRKILNRANKVFTLSKFHPVGVMIYNSAQFMATPWETIIKTYRKQLKDKSYSTLEEYLKDFIQFLHSKNLFSEEGIQKAFLREFFVVVINVIINDAIRINKDLLRNPTDENKTKIIALIESETEEIIENLTSNTEICEELTDFDEADFTAFVLAEFNAAIDKCFTTNGFDISEELKGKIKTALYLFLLSKETMTTFTGLVFVGFGENEIYPQLIPVNVSMAIQDKLRYFIEDSNKVSISDTFNGAIRPFAQTDVIDTILTGVDPTLDATYHANFKAAFEKYNQEILRLLGNTNPQLTAQIQALNIDQLVNEYASKNNDTKRSNYIQPLMNAVSSLSKEDLAEMAESLIYLTYLKRRITFAEESVGGPVDVAIISKGDGFIWMKRKHYFDPELNQHFFDNYFKI